MLRAFALVALVGLVACHATPAPPASNPATRSVSVVSTPPASVEPLDVTLRVRAERAGQKFGVGMDDKLKSGDFLELFVTVNQPAYIYVVQFFPDGKSELIFPEIDHPIQPGAERRIPEAKDESLQLDDRTGGETLYVLATRTPVDKADRAIAGTIADLRVSNTEPARTAVSTRPAPKKSPPVTKVPAVGSGGAPKPAPREEHFLTLATRGVKRVKRAGNEPAIAGTAEKREDGLLVVRFTFQHEN